MKDVFQHNFSDKEIVSVEDSTIARVFINVGTSTALSESRPLIGAKSKIHEPLQNRELFRMSLDNAPVLHNKHKANNVGTELYMCSYLAL